MLGGSRAGLKLWGDVIFGGQDRHVKETMLETTMRIEQRVSDTTPPSLALQRLNIVPSGSAVMGYRVQGSGFKELIKCLRIPKPTLRKCQWRIKWKRT